MRLSSTRSTVPRWTPSAPITSICSRMSSKPLIDLSPSGLRAQRFARDAVHAAAPTTPVWARVIGARLVPHRQPRLSPRAMARCPHHHASRRADRAGSPALADPCRDPPRGLSAARLAGARRSGSTSTSALERTRVRATLNVERNGEHDRPLRLDGDELEAAVGQGRRRGRRTGGWTARSWSSTSPATARRSRPRSRSAPRPTPS